MNLSTTYLGLPLPHPFIAGASPLADSLDSIRRFEDVGLAAVVVRSLFQEQLDNEALAAHHATEAHAHSYGEATTYLPEHDDYVLGPEEYLAHLSRLKSALDIPIIASLNGSSSGGWLTYAKMIEQTGVDALELNVYDVVVDFDRSSAEIEQDALDMVRAIRANIDIPIAVKLGPFYTALPHFARGLINAGANGLVLFNRFFAPDVDLEELELHPRLQLSDSSELPLRLRWLAILSERIDASLAVSGGVHSPQDAIKAVMCGAHAVQMVSAFLKEGPLYLSRICHTIQAWLQDEEYESLEQMHGSMGWTRCPNPQALSRVNYMHLLKTWKPEE